MPSQAQRKRAEARESRRGDEPDEPQQADGSSSEDQPLDTVKQAAKVAAASMAAAAVAAGVRALAERRHSSDNESSDDEEQPEPPSGEAEPEVPEPEAEEPESESQDDQDREPEAEAAEPEPEPKRKQPEPEQREQPEPTARHEPVRGATADEAGEVVEGAKRQLEQLVGKAPETVSGLERTDDGWLVTVEVVEVSRVPESTDVLASYEIELDDDRNLRRYERLGRYHRSQADRDGA